MKKIILVLVLFFNILPCFKHGRLTLFQINTVFAEGGEGYSAKELEEATVCGDSKYTIHDLSDCRYDKSWEETQKNKFNAATCACEKDGSPEITSDITETTKEDNPTTETIYDVDFGDKVCNIDVTMHTNGCDNDQSDPYGCTYKDKDNVTRVTKTFTSGCQTYDQDYDQHSNGDPDDNPGSPYNYNTIEGCSDDPNNDAEGSHKRYIKGSVSLNTWAYGAEKDQGTVNEPSGSQMYWVTGSITHDSFVVMNGGSSVAKVSLNGTPTVDYELSDSNTKVKVTIDGVVDTTYSDGRLINSPFNRSFTRIAN